MAAPPTGTDRADAQPGAAPAGGVSAEAGPPRLAPALPPPAPDARLLVGSLVLLGLTLALVGLAAGRLRPRRRPQLGLRETVVAGLEGLQSEADARCCAGQVRLLLARFLEGATGLPCTAMTVSELASRLAVQPAARQAALNAILEVLQACDMMRFAASHDRDANRLAGAAIAAVRLWPAELEAAGMRPSAGEVS